MTPAIWMKTLCGGSMNAVLALYAPNAVLVPTYGAVPLVGHRQMASYFRRFLGERPRLCGHIQTVQPQHMPGFQVYSGLYTFKWHGGAAKARYTFVMFGGKILTQHSSEVP